MLMSIAAVLTALNLAYAQQESQKDAANPYLKGTEGYYKGPRGLTSYMPIAIDQPFAARMAHDVSAKRASNVNIRRCSRSATTSAITPQRTSRCINPHDSARNARLRSPVRNRRAGSVVDFSGYSEQLELRQHTKMIRRPQPAALGRGRRAVEKQPHPEYLGFYT